MAGESGLDMDPSKYGNDVSRNISPRASQNESTQSTTPHVHVDSLRCRLYYKLVSIIYLAV